jgi:hypothetical protein
MHIKIEIPNQPDLIALKLETGIRRPDRLSIFMGKSI